MTRVGTVVNGVIVPDGPPPPEGARVRLLVGDEAVLWDELAAGPPPATESRDEHLENLRQSLADIKDGRGVPAVEAFAQIRADLGLPPVARGAR